MIELEVRAIVGSDSGSGNAALILKERFGKRQMLVVVDNNVGKNIYGTIKGYKEPTPSMHDVFESFLKQMGAVVKFVVVTKFVNGIYFTDVVVGTAKSSVLKVEARISDAILLAVKFKAPIYCTEVVIDETAVDIETTEGAESISFSGAPEDETVRLESLTDEELEQGMKMAVENENYALASAYRDERNRRKGL